MKLKNTQKMKTTILTLLAIVALSLGSCKKTTPTPVEPVTCVPTTPVNPNVGIHIHIESLASTSTGSLIGTLELHDDSDTSLNGSVMLLQRNFNVSNSIQYVYDTTFVLTNQSIRALTYLVSETQSAVDVASDTQIKIYFDGELKYWGAGPTIFNQTLLK